MPTVTYLQSKELTLRNLATDVSAEIRHEIQNQRILSIPREEYSDDHYFSNGGQEGILQMDQDIADIIEGGNKSTWMNRLDLQMWNAESLSRNSGSNAMENGKGYNGNIVNHDISLRIGQSPVVNPPWQFNELDDVRSNTVYPHMGRVYLTYIYSHFPILVFQPGREKINANMLTFFTKGLGIDHKVLNKYIRSGGDSGILNKIATGLINIKNVVLAGIEGVLSLLGVKFADINKFITFKPAMKLYRKLANGLMSEYAAELGLLDLTTEKYNSAGMNFESTKNESAKYFEDENTLDSENSEMKEALKAYKAAQVEGDENADSVFTTEDENDIFGSEVDINVDESDVGETFGGEDDDLKDLIKDGLKDIYEFGSHMSRTYRGTIQKLDVIDMIPNSTFKTTNGFNNIMKLAGDINNMSYLPFLCQSNVSISESFSNNTKEHPVVAEINSLSEAAGDEKGFGGVKTAIDAAKGLLDPNNAAQKAWDFVKSVGMKMGKEAVSGISELGMLINGDGKMVVPEIWSNSSYSRTYSVDFKFWSPLGDIVSVFENTYIPFILLQCLASPLQTGFNAYVSPFVVKVFSRGLFSVDFGMIENLSITRGDGQNDRTEDNFPRSIKVSVSIKDLSPVLMLSLGVGAFWKYRRANSSLSEYIATMCNLSLSDRFNIARQWDKFWAMLTANVRNKLSLSSIGFSLSNKLYFKPLMMWNRNKITVDTTKTNQIRY